MNISFTSFFIFFIANIIVFLKIRKSIFAQVVFPNIRDAFTAGGRIAFENGKHLPNRYPQIYKTIIDHLPTIRTLLERPSRETIELIHEFNPILLEDNNPFKSWTKLCGATCGEVMVRWLKEKPKLE